MKSTLVDEFENAMFDAVITGRDIVEIRVNPEVYRAIELESILRETDAGLRKLIQKHGYTLRFDFGDINAPIVKDETVETWLVIRKSDFEDKPKALAETKSLFPKNTEARIQMHTEYRIEDTTDGDRCIVLFALEEGMIPEIHRFVSFQEAEGLLKEFSEHHTITLRDYHSLTEAKFRPMWVSICRETHALRKASVTRTVDTKQGDDLPEDMRYKSYMEERMDNY